MQAACVCGACIISSDADPQMVYCCHCEDCQRMSGTDFQVIARFSPGQLKLKAEEEHVARFSKQGSPMTLLHCRKCHVHLCTDGPCDSGGSTLLAVPVGLVTGSPLPDRQALPWQPTDHAFYASRACDVFDELPKWSKFLRDSDLLEGQSLGRESALAGSLPTPPISLSCFCSKTRARNTAAPSKIYYCHCDACRRLSGAAFAHNALFGPGQLEVLEGANNLVRHSKTGSHLTTVRCGLCFSIMWREGREATTAPVRRFAVPVGVVDKTVLGDPAWHPQFHLFWSQRALPARNDGLRKWAERAG